ncbi:type II toxin-antitoxin system Phd/YefM family antitoxin [Terrarubrum flagellatum]|uniref:type II toxin-antitoxin system Phd/YefM family antitoxin n=1 Tax=Terrirubrum flagellatum TaxID=2895980 RepID=UPI003144F7C1
MRNYTLTDLSNKSGEIAEAAFRGPVTITSRGKRKFVLLTAEDYDRLTQQADKRRVVHVDDLTPEQAAIYIATLSEPADESLRD